MDVVTLALSKQYTKEQINNLLSVGFMPVVVDTLPEIGAADSNKIYLVPSEKAEGDNNYLEYLAIEGAWECIGSTAINFEEYATKEELEQAVTDKATQEYVDEAIANNNKTFIVTASNFSTGIRGWYEQYKIDGNFSNIYFKTSSNYLIPAEVVGNSSSTNLKLYFTGPSSIASQGSGQQVALLRFDITLSNGQISTITKHTDETEAQIWPYKNNASMYKKYTLATDNAAAYTPTSNYHPATKKYVDDTVNTAHADTQEYIEEVVQSIQTAQNNLEEAIQTTQNYVANTLTVFDGDEDEYLALTQEQRDSYLIAIVNPLAVLKEEETSILNSILLDTEQTATIVDLTDEEVEEEVNEIIGGAQ